jgi:hypothetical protein
MKIEMESPNKLLRELEALIDLYIETHHSSFMLAFPEIYRIYRRLKVKNI